jgi:phosphatidylethanolamine/phosphatidyl-N-methylethanolamine N-methyltransferase
MTAMAALRKSLSRRFDEELRFIRSWRESPKTTGAILPSGNVMARKMASVVEPSSGLPVLEIGPGTGVMTRAILERGVPAERLFLIEFSATFARRLRADFPGVNVIQGDAFELSRTLGEHAGLTFDSVISSLPLLSFPVEKRIALIEGLLDRLPAGRPVVQFSYQPFSPVPPGRGNYEVEIFRHILRNIPPAKTWLYTRPWQVAKREPLPVAAE